MRGARHWETRGGRAGGRRWEWLPPPPPPPAPAMVLLLFFLVLFLLPTPRRRAVGWGGGGGGGVAGVRGRSNPNVAAVRKTPTSGQDVPGRTER